MINPALRDSPKHLTLLAHMVLGYTELEMRYATIAGRILALDYEVLNAAEKIYSETTRIKMIHALCRRAFKFIGLGKEYSIAYKMIFYCAGLRNTYAHAQWIKESTSKGLKYVDGNEMFENDIPAYEDLPKKQLPLKLLREQATYFEVTRQWLLWLDLTLGQMQQGKPSLWKLPPEMPQPPKHYSPQSKKPDPKKTTPPAARVSRWKSEPRK